MRILASACLTAAILLTSTAAVDAAVVAKYPLTAEPRELTTRFTFTATVPTPPSADGTAPLDVWVPMPSTDTWQTVSDEEITAPGKYSVNQEKKYHDRMVYVHIDHPAYPVSVTASFTVDRHEPRGPSDATKNDISQLPVTTTADARVPVGGRFRQIALGVSSTGLNTIQEELALFRSVVTNMRYDYKKKSPKYAQGDSAFVCRYKMGNCSDLHSYLTSLSRSIDIPAIIEFGFPLTGIPVPKSIPVDGSVEGYHCWMWFKDGNSWLPVDAADARRWQDARRLDVRNYLFGDLLLPRSAVAVSRGRDITLVPAQKGAPLNYFIYPYAEAGGKPIKAKWTVGYHIIRQG